MVDEFDDGAWIAFLSDNSSKRPVLLYLTEALASANRKSSLDYLKVDTDTDYIILKRFEEKGPKEQFKLLLVTDDQCMLSLDFCAPHLNICFLAFKPLLSDEVASLGLARVKKHQDPCERLLLHCFTLLDRNAEAE